MTMAGKQYLDIIRKELKNSPLALISFLGLVQICLEKILEEDFSCPCDASINELFTTGYFILPAIPAFILVLHIKGRSCKGWFVAAASAVVWFIILFLDGQYFACGSTTWSGTYETIPNSDTQKWCNPGYSRSTEEKMEKTQEWYYKSQGYGMIFILFLILLYVFGICCCCCCSCCRSCCCSCCSKNQDEEDAAEEQNELRADVNVGVTVDEASNSVVIRLPLNRTNKDSAESQN